MVLFVFGWLPVSTAWAVPARAVQSLLAVRRCVFCTGHLILVAVATRGGGVAESPFFECRRGSSGGSPGRRPSVKQ